MQKTAPIAEISNPLSETAKAAEAYRSVLKSLLLGGLAAVLAWLFLEVSGEVIGGGTRSLDLALLHAAQRLRAEHASLGSVMRDLSGVGSTLVLSLLTSMAVLYLLLLGRGLQAYLLAASVASGSLAVFVMKTAFGRSRPDPAFADMVALGLSFPSGHASISALVFLSLGALLASGRERLVERAFILFAAALMAVLIGLSRIALGVHWASDVVGGWAFGAAWAVLFLLLARKLARRG
ncbi:phosphatase PAP2 family protein [Paucibacter sp. Y2R2-4]|uniref:phosphatase PAP2 family protein n=1 Tax=Paucibacter sp. Y2R2-4 TaxID=2893553 RepID=UPI0021E3A3EE|nr:phosphatase PAP2 family protein [Paucibacter sp. Y2R2-4]MCV2351573.1 phosphatase PAP2 family protein [Paucibacter sp. Y2R2-4]